MLDKYSLPTGWAFPVGQFRPLSIAFTLFLALLFVTPTAVLALPAASETGEDPQVIEDCDILGYQNENSRSFVIPEFGQFKASGSGLTLTRFADNTATITGTMEKVNQQWKKFEVELHFSGAYNYSEWLDLGYQAKGANLGDESTWTFYELDEDHDNQLVGLGGLSGEVLNVYNADPNYGLQIGQGANDKDGDFGFSWWFNYPNSEGHGDINADTNCECPEDGISFTSVPENVSVNCGEEIPAPAEVIATNNSGEELDVDFTEFASETGAEEICDLENGDQHAIWFNDDDVVGNNLNQRFDFVENGTFEQFPDGTAKLTGTVENRNDDDARFSFTVWLKNESTFEEWTNIPNAASPTGFRQPKLDAGTSVDIDDQYLGWTYYEIDESKNNEFVGEGDLSGYSGTITHRPSNLRWGVQVGDRASLQSLGHGISFWFDVEGTNYHGDFNMSITDCEDQDEEFDCADDYTVVRTWTATDNCGNTSSVAQTIEINGDDEAPTLDQSQIEFTDCDIDLSQIEAAVSDNCDEDPEVSVEIISVSNGSGGSSDDCQFRTQTPGGWGAPANGNNPGAYLHANFNQVFPNGITIGCDNSFTFTTAQSITSFLPSGGQPSQLPNGDAVNPTNYGNSFAGHVLSLSISVAFDNAIADFGDSQGNLADAIVSGGSLAGMTVGEVLAEANAVIGGCDSDYSLSELHETVTSINENYVDGDQDNGFISCEEGGNECVFVYEIEVVAVDDCGNELNEVFTFEVEDNSAPTLSETPADLTLECGEEIPSYEITATDNCDEEVEVAFEEMDGGAVCEVLPTLSQFNLVSFGDATLFNSDIEGQALVCGNASFTNYGVASTLSGVEGSSLQVGGNLTYTNGQVFSGDVTVSGIVSTSGLNVLDGNLNEGQPLSVDCNELLSEANETSSTLSGLAANGTVEDSYGTVTLTCQGENVSVFDVDAAMINNANGIYINDCSSADAVIINVSGGTVDFSNFQIFTNTESENIIWNLSEAGSVNISGIGIKGTLLAPNAAISFNNGHIDGSLIGGSISGNGESHNFLFEGELEGCESECAQVITRTWTATDDCGNSTEHTQTITIEDNEAPVLVGVPENQTGLCDATFEAAEVTATDNCDENVEVSVEETASGEGCDYTITFTYTATDECGNTATDSYSTSVEDNEAPVLSETPADLTKECDEEIPSYEITATDNCDEEVAVEFSETTDEQECGYLLVRTWTVTDDCGNSTEHTQTITIEDNEAPVLVGVPENQTGLCDATFEAAEVTATDNCDENVAVSVEESTSGEGCDYTITFTYTATDDCGNTATDSYSISVEDNEAPVLSETPADLTKECDEEIPSYEITATDNCDESVEVEFEETTEELDCGSVITRTWIATDDCGNSTEHTQTITIEDNEAPVLVGVPENQIGLCDATFEAAEVAATDNCDAEVEVSVEESTSGEGCDYTITFTYTAADDCGNTATDSYSFSVEDNEAPVLSEMPADLTKECDEEIPSYQITATDNCDESVEVAFEETTETLDCGSVITRTWIATDDCGNSTEHMQTITIEDNEAPVLVGVPENQTGLCDATFEAAEVTATDNCDENVEVSVEETTSGEGCDYTITFTYTATDDCGNTATDSYSFSVEDNEAPVLSEMPADLTKECDEEIPPYQITATDNCDESVEVAFEETTETLDCGSVITRTWIATDDCGNSTEHMQTITVEDNEAPVLSGVPENTTVVCDQIPAAAEVTASDNCSYDVEVVFTEEIGEGCPYTITRTWTATDDCGNTVSEIQEITVNDVEAPVLVGVPEDITGECGDAPQVAEVTATDNCDPDVEVVYTEEVIGEVCPLTIIRTWTATDNCGNSVSASQTIEIDDETAPEIEGVPENVTVECDAVPADPQVSVSDNCDANPTLEFSEEIIPHEPMMEGAEPCGYTIVRTWVATDICGNTSTAQQEVEVVDTVAPELVGVPENITVECGEIPEPAEVTAVDNCYEGEMEVLFTEEMIGSECGYQIVRTWTVEDNCWNYASQSQVITVEDTTAPVLLGVPQNETIDCDQEIAEVQVSATDNCDEEVEISMESETEDLACGYLLTKTWTATDNCGNSSSATQVITVIDEEAPVLIGVPEDATVACDQVPAAAEVSAEDNCSANVEVIFTEEVGEGCPYTITRTWTAADDCGNTASQSQVISVIDEEAPVLNGVPADTTVECDQIPAVADVSASDNCTETVDVSFSESFDQAECGYTIVRTWSAEDLCGNEIVETQTISVTDSTNPSVVSHPEDLTLECTESTPADSPEFTDNCDEELEVAYSEVVTELECGQEVVQSWTAIDNCGNETSVSRTVTFNDTTAPVFVNAPEDVTYECTQVPNAPELDAEDNCDDEVEISFEESVEDLECGFIITRTWTATDDCGNEVSVSQTVTAIDETAPEVLSSPEDATVECDEEIPNDSPEFADNCTEELSIEASSSIEQLDCGYLINKVWTATDECGNTTSVEQQITVIDTTAPEVLSAPANVTIECDEAEPTDQPVFTDNCDEELEITAASSISELECGYQIQKTWTATDDCGNETSVSQVITVVDETAPELLGVPANATVECDQVPTAAEVTANDNCDDQVEVNFTESIEELECGYIITRIWSAADDCGNAVEATQTITVEDNTNPELIGVPENTTVECDAIPEIAEVSAQDNCDENLTVNVTETTEEQECGYLLIRTWAVHDNCGNSNSATQIITVEDTTAPVIISSPEDLNVECSEVPGFGQIEVEDNCDEDLTIETSESQVSVECGYELTRTWTVMDDCGNTAVATQTILVADTTEPEIIGIPEDVTIECGEDLPETPEVEFVDNCDPNPIYWITEEVEQLDCGYQVIRIFRAVDECANENIQTWVITVTDQTAPVFGDIPADTTVQCGIDGPVPTVTATDICDDEVEIEYSEEVSDGCPYTITRTWTAIDDCGNSSVATQVITVEDNEAPTFVNIEPLVNVECDEVGDFTVEATDNCGEVEIGIQSELVFSGGCLGTIERVWIATDQCGNSTTYLQLIHIEDTTAPEIFNAPADVTIDCEDEIPAVSEDVFAEDNCNDVEIIFDEEVSGEFCPYTITRTWTAIDDCGNMTQAEQVITVEVDVPQQQVDILAYPNPFNNQFTVTFSIPRDAKVRASIHDMTGKKMMDLFDGKADAWTLYEFNKTSNWDSGTYILHLVVDGEVHHHKLIVNNQ